MEGLTEEPSFILSAATSQRWAGEKILHQHQAHFGEKGLQAVLIPKRVTRLEDRGLAHQEVSPGMWQGAPWKER